MNLSPLPLQKFFDNDGNPLAGGQLFTYVAGTTTKIATYSNQAGTLNSNPVVLDFRGEANVWLDQTLTYKFVLAPRGDTDPPTRPIWTVDNISAAITFASLTQQILGQILYPRTAPEIAAGVTPVSYAYQPGDLRRYGCDLTGGTDNSTQIANAILAAVASGGVGYIFHPGGTISHASQIVVPNGLTVCGWSRAESIFTFTGSPGGAVSLRSGWRYNSGAVNSSGYANVHFKNVRLHYQNSVNFSAVLEINAGGWSYFSVDNCWLSGSASYGLILDSVELCFIHDNLIENVTNISTGGNVWITNGEDRSTGQTRGFSNVISIRDNQISGTGGYGLIDDGGYDLDVGCNNFNGHRFPVRIAGRSTLKLGASSLETPLQTGTANAVFDNTSLNGSHVGPCIACSLENVGFFGNISAGSLLDFASSSTFTITAITKAASAVITVSTVSSANPFFNDCPLTITGVVGMTEINFQTVYVTATGGSSGAWTATVRLDTSAYGAYVSGGVISGYHAGFDIKSCVFGSQLGRGGAINVTYLANSRIGPNVDAGTTSMSHYLGVHTDALGNYLNPPAVGSQTTFNINGPTNCDTRLRTGFNHGVQFKRQTVTYSASMTFDLLNTSGNHYDITATNGVAFTINSPGNASDGCRFVVTIRNTSGGALGAATFGPSFKIGAAWTQPATGFQRSIEFAVDSGGFSHEINRTAADVTN